MKVIERNSRKYQVYVASGKKRTVPIKNKLDLNNIIRFWKRKIELEKTDSSRNKAYRNYMILLLGFNTAFRAEDLLQLRVDKVYKGYMTIYEFKTGKPQNFPLNKLIHREVKDYVEQMKLSKSDYLFWNYYPGSALPITKTGANKVLKKAAEYVKLKQDFSLHAMRKTFGYQQVLAGVNPFTVMKMLNHSTLLQTMHYICWDSQDAENERINTHFGV